MGGLLEDAQRLAAKRGLLAYDAQAVADAAMARSPMGLLNAHASRILNANLIQGASIDPSLAKPGTPLNPKATLGDGITFAANAAPGIGDALAVADAVDFAKQGKMGWAALSGLGALPLIPGMAGVVGKNLPDYADDAARRMAKLKKPTPINAYEADADKIMRSLDSSGFIARRESSRVSKSEYIYARTPDYLEDEAGNVIQGREWKIRVSDHELPGHYEQADLDVITNADQMRGDAVGTWVNAVDYITEKSGVAPRGNAKRLINELRKTREASEAAEALRREQAKAFAKAQEPIKTNFAEWLSTLPDDAAITVSNRGVIRADVGGKIVEFGPKPHGFSKNLSTAGLAKRHFK